MSDTKQNRLETEPVASLLRSFAVPSIIAMLVNSLYNIVDQFFIGQTVGTLGVAATNIQYPLSIACAAIGLLFGVGGASSFNLAIGQSRFDTGERKKAAGYMGNAIVSMVTLGVLLFAVTELFLNPLLLLLGSPNDTLPYASVYTRIVAFGFPFQILSLGGGHLLRADGRPRTMMICNLTGALTNVVLDALFLMVFDMGMFGAALATVIGQIAACLMVAYSLMHTRTVTLKRSDFSVSFASLKQITSLGMAMFFTQIAMMVVQIVLNNSLKHYGALSSYGSSIPIAASGIIMKINQIYLSVVIGISQGMQPIIGYNYGARRYDRVRRVYLLSMISGFVISLIAFLLFQIFPEQIISLFGTGSPEYYDFSIRFFRIFLLFTFVDFIQPLTGNAFTAMGKSGKGAFMSLTRMVLFLLPLLLILPVFFGIDGILYAGPIADGLAAVVCIAFAIREFSDPKYRESTSGPASDAATESDF